jgi:hypothetical protein
MDIFKYIYIPWLGPLIIHIRLRRVQIFERETISLNDALFFLLLCLF